MSVEYGGMFQSWCSQKNLHHGSYKMKVKIVALKIKENSDSNKLEFISKIFLCIKCNFFNFNKDDDDCNDDEEITTMSLYGSNWVLQNFFVLECLRVYQLSKRKRQLKD